ncbi:MAG: ABC transporter ATP-binding protein [Chloroflexota bacterium]|jgi:ABC-2 type transport system ATP-binding protein
MNTIIAIQHLSKQYGKLTALNDLTIEVEKGDVVGFIGPNGAGKTTTMRILTTLLQPTLGQAWLAGYSIIDEPEQVRRVVGYMPDFFGVYEDMKVWEYLDFFAACYRLPLASRDGLIDDLLSLVDLIHKRDAYVDSLSRGMKQRLCLARTLAHDPEVLILDEPASGLDPRARIEMRELLRELKNMGKTIFFSSHILSEVADVCTKIAILEAGRLVAYGDMAEMKRQLRPNRLIRLQTLSDPLALQAFLATAEHVRDVRVGPDSGLPDGALRVEFSGEDQALSALLTALIDRGFALTSFAEESDNLEDVFMQVTKGVVR